jgi:hypothetical protein
LANPVSSQQEHFLLRSCQRRLKSINPVFIDIPVALFIVCSKVNPISREHYDLTVVLLYEFPELIFPRSEVFRVYVHTDRHCTFEYLSLSVKYRYRLESIAFRRPKLIRVVQVGLPRVEDKLS